MRLVLASDGFLLVFCEKNISCKQKYAENFSKWLTIAQCPEVIQSYPLKTTRSSSRNSWTVAIVWVGSENSGETFSKNWIIIFFFFPKTTYPKQEIFLFFFTKVRNILDWLENSPDPTPLENVWAVVKKPLQKQKISRERSEGKIREVWSWIAEKTVRNLFENYQKDCI